MIDIVIPNNNEEEFITIAGKLGYKELLFLYSFDNYINLKNNPNKKKEIEGKSKKNQDPLWDFGRPKKHSKNKHQTKR